MAQSELESIAFSSPSSTTSSLPSAMSTEGYTHDDLFYFHSVVFLAGTKLFKVPRASPNPVRLEADVTAADFRSLLKATFPPPGKLAAALTLDEWMGVLKLAKKWNLESMKDKAVDGADEEIQSMPVIDKILFAQKYGVDKWLKEGYCSLARREDPITPEERVKLGWETYGRLMNVREQGRLSSLDSPLPHEQTLEPCKACGHSHVPFCNANTNGKVNGDMRQCSWCSGAFHSIGCSTGIWKNRMLDRWATVDFEVAVEKEFGGL
ncbi:unnamed protein product [Peniophora sp. CBMAI 1063]|nr:unnamed protein product [Peniophora sp. CBMAI 1063]